MITTENLELIPPVHGRERTFAWFPPAYGQYDRAPYKSMATLDDFKYFSPSTVTEVIILDGCDTKRTNENDGTVLNSKLNAIRQQLSKRRIDPNTIRQQCFMKPNSIQDFMKIPANWKPKYPEPNIEMLCVQSENEYSQIDRELTDTNSGSDHLVIPDGQEGKEQAAIIKKPLIRRPHTAPGLITRAESTPKCISTNNNHRPYSSSTMSQKPSRPKSSLRQRLEQTTCSEQNIPTLCYEKDLDKYKWLMEIPRDPFEIKKPHLPERQQYFHQIADIKVLPQEPTMKKQNRDTFFYNSMPSQSLSFDISPNFVSEKFNRIKDRLRSQGKWNYSSKNFSFVY